MVSDQCKKVLWKRIDFVSYVKAENDKIIIINLERSTVFEALLLMLFAS